MQTEPKRHHYIPQFFLKGFSADEKKVWVFDRYKKEYRQESIRKTGAETKFYSYTVKGKEETLEGVFSMVEGLAKPILEKVLLGKDITEQEKADFSMFLAIMRVRVPDFKKSTEEGGELMYKKYNKIMFSDEENIKAMAKERKVSLTDNQVKELKDFVSDESRYYVTFPKNYWLGLMLKLSLDVASAFIGMNWHFVHLKKRFALVTSDNPVVLVPPKDYDPNGFYGVGLITPGASKIIALDSTLCLFMGDLVERPWIKHAKDDNKELLKWINYKTSENSDRFVYSPDKGKLEKIVKVTKIDKFLTKERVVVQ